MFSFKENKHVEFSADEIFSLVSDIEKYPQFVPGCKDIKILQKDDKKIIAIMTVGSGPIIENFKSQVILEKNKIIIAYLDGPFKYLENTWQFIDDKKNGGSVIDFYIKFEFKSKILNLTFGKFFIPVCKKMVDAFINRANNIYK